MIIGKDAQETYKDGDAYVGEDKDDPDWVWNVSNIKDGTVSTTTSTTAEFTGPFFGIENDFIYNDDSDNPPKIGECLDLPNNYVSICLDSLTVSDDNYATYTIEYESSTDLSDAIKSLTAAKTVQISTSQTEGILIRRANLDEVNGTSTGNVKTNKVWLYAASGSADAESLAIDNGANDTAIGIFYKDTDDNKVKLAGLELPSITLGGPAGQGASALEINYDNTKDTDLRMFIHGNDSAGGNYTLVMVPYHSTNLPDYLDNISMEWGRSSGAFSSLGATASSEEAGEIGWLGKWKDTAINTIGTKDEDHKTRYGIIIRDPKAHGSSDEVVMDIPGDAVEANVVIKGTTAKTTSSGGSVVVNPIPSSAAALSEEVTSASAQHLIVIGGPAVNPLANSVFGLTRTDFTPNEAMVKLADNGANVALLVAGYSAVDTRNAAAAIAAGKLAGMSKAEAKVVSTTQTVGSYTVE